MSDINLLSASNLPAIYARIIPYYITAIQIIFAYVMTQEMGLSDRAESMSNQSKCWKLSTQILRISVWIIITDDLGVGSFGDGLVHFCGRVVLGAGWFGDGFSRTHNTLHRLHRLIVIDS